MIDIPFFYFHISTISRNRGEMVGSNVSYITGKKIRDDYYGLTHARPDRGNPLYTEVLLPENTPLHFFDMNRLVTEMEYAGNRKNARIAKEVRMSFFNNNGIGKDQSFTLDEYIALMKNYVQKAFINLGMCAIIAIHEGKNKTDSAKDNPHAHIIITDRPVDQNGFCPKKNRDWIKTSYLIHWRQLWAEMQNKEFERKGIKIRVSEKSYIMLGIDKKPTKHLSKAVIALKNRSIETDRSIEHDSILKWNAEHEEQKRQQEKERDRDRDRGRGR